MDIERELQKLWRADRAKQCSVGLYKYTQKEQRTAINSYGFGSRSVVSSECCTENEILYCIPKMRYSGLVVAVL